MAQGVRPARPGEGALLGEIYLESGRAAWAGHLPEDGLAAVRSAASDWERLISDPEVIVLVAQIGDGPVALAVLCPSPDPDADPAEVALLDRLYTEPAAWGRGLGRSLLGRAMDELRRRGIQEVTLWTAEWNGSRGFYEALGWRPDGAMREKTFAGRTFREMRYRTAVSP
jgi:GNAT superfamily N-acetyltransferase